MDSKPVVSALRLRSANGSLNGNDPCPVPEAGEGILAMSGVECEVSLPAHLSILIELHQRDAHQSGNPDGARLIRIYNQIPSASSA